MTKKQGGKPAKFKIHERLNPLHPADDVTMEELEGEWGTPDDVKPLSEAELNRYRSRLSRKRKPPDFNGLTLPPKVVRDAWFGSESEKKPTTKRRNINPLYPPPDISWRNSLLIRHTGAIVIVVGTGLLVYFKKRKHQLLSHSSNSFRVARALSVFANLKNLILPLFLC